MNVTVNTLLSSVASLGLLPMEANNIVNPGAEAGTTGWEMRDQSLPLAVASSSAHSGQHYFAAGNTAYGRWDQQIAIPSRLFAEIDNGAVDVTLSSYRAGYTDADTSGMYLQFFDQAGTQIGAVFQPRTDPGNSTTSSLIWTLSTLTTSIPEKARFLRLGVWQVRAAGSESSTYFDDFAILYTFGDTSKERGQLLFIAPKAEDIVGFAGSSTAFAQNAEAQRFQLPGFGLLGTGEVSKNFSIPGRWHSRIDSGTATFSWFFMMGNYPSGSDTGRLRLIWTDIDGMDLTHAAIESHAANTNVSVLWELFSRNGSIPAGARGYRLVYSGTAVSGNNADCYFSQMDLRIAAPK